MIPATVSVAVAAVAVFVFVAPPVAAAERIKCFDFRPAPPFDEWQEEGSKDYDEYMRCFKTAYHRAVVSCHPEYHLDNIHVLSPEEVEWSLQQERQYLGEGDEDRRRFLTITRALKKKGKGGGGSNSGGGNCNQCPPEPIGQGGNNAANTGGFRRLRPAGTGRIRAAVSRRHNMEGCESRRAQLKGKDSRKKLFTSYLTEMSQFMTECVRIHRETNNLFHDYLERGDKVQVQTCLMAAKGKSSNGQFDV